MSQYLSVLCFLDITEWLLKLCCKKSPANALLSWMYSHPHAYRSILLLLNDNENFSKHDLRVFLPYVPRVLRSENVNKSVHITIRAERNGISLNGHGSSSCERVETALHRVILLFLLWPKQVYVTLICADILVTQLLLTHPLFHYIDVNELYSHGMIILDALKSRRAPLRISAFSASVEKQPNEQSARGIYNASKLVIFGNGYHSSTSLQSVYLLPFLQEVVLSGIPINTLSPMANMKNLNMLDVSSTLINDRDVVTLSLLPQLTTVKLNECQNITNINHFSMGVAPIRHISAARCPRMFHYESVGQIRGLEYVDLSYACGISMGLLLSSSTFALNTMVLNFSQFPADKPPERIIGEEGGGNLLQRVLNLSLVGATIVHMEWLCFASNVQVLQLDHTFITEKDLTRLSKKWTSLSTLSVRECRLLRTNLKWVLSLTLLVELHISRSSIIHPTDMYVRLGGILFVH